MDHGGEKFNLDPSARWGNEADRKKVMSSLVHPRTAGRMAARAGSTRRETRTRRWMARRGLEARASREDPDDEYACRGGGDPAGDRDAAVGEGDRGARGQPASEQVEDPRHRRRA